MRSCCYVNFSVLTSGDIMPTTIVLISTCAYSMTHMCIHGLLITSALPQKSIYDRICKSCVNKVTDKLECIK